MKNLFLVTIVEANERENLYFDEEIDARIEFEDCKKDCCSVFLAKKELDGNYLIIETFVKQLN